MARHTLSVTVTVTVTTLTATAALLLGGCGGGDGDSSPGGIKGAGSASASAAASASASVSVSAGAPDVSVPDDLDLVFDFAKPSDARSAAALADAENYIRALDHGIAAQDPEDPAYKYYSDGPAAEYAKSQIKAWVKGSWTVTGTDQYSNAETTTLSNKNVVVTFCRNQAKFYSKEIKTGKILYTEESPSSYQKFTLLMNPPSGSSQAWKAMAVEVKGEVEECGA